MTRLSALAARLRGAWRYLTPRGQQVAVTAAALLLLALVAVVQTATREPQRVERGSVEKPRGTSSGAAKQGSDTACPTPAKRRVKRGPKRERLVALTFDDGPGPFTDPLRRVLREHDAHATFFVVANTLPERPDEVRALVRDGNEIGNHSLAHADLRAMARGASADMRTANRAIVRAGAHQPCVFRPPYGAFDRKLVDRARRLGMTTVTWSVDSRDYAGDGGRQIAKTVLDEVEPGSIVLMHDAGGVSRKPTVRATDRILRKLRARGYRAVTLSDLLAQGPRARRRP